MFRALPRSLTATLVTLAMLMGLSCGSKDPSGPGAIENSLVFTREDSSAVVFSNAPVLLVWCEVWEEGVVLTQTLHIVFGGPGPGDPNWHLRAVVADVNTGVPLFFPNNFVFDDPRNVDLFISDAADNPKNELSTQDTRSSGSITFQALQCINGGVVQFSIDAVVGSEFGNGPSVSVAGSFRAIVSTASI